MSAPTRTTLSYQGLLARSSCGYCSTSEGTSPRRCSFYVKADALTAEHYQCLIDRGWRRSGTLLYKPHLKLTCCKQYAIRLDPAQFKPSRDKRQCLNKWNRYILGDEYIKEAAKRYPKTKEEKKRQQEFDLAETVHAAEYSTLVEKDVKKILPAPAHRYEVKLEPAGFTEEKYQLYKAYQIHVHHDAPSSITPASFKRFLCHSPLPTTATSPKPLGSYHQCHYLDGALIALGFLDLLPHAVSSVYLLYTPALEAFKIGKITACREALLSLELGYGWYYMGYYIHTCGKMRYKGEYAPSYLLDPETYRWHALDAELKRKLDERAYFSPDNPDSEPDPRVETEEESLFSPGAVAETRMPGAMGREELKRFPLGDVEIKLGGRRGLEADMLVGFEEEGSTVRKLFEDLVGTVGERVGREMVVSFG